MRPIDADALKESARGISVFRTYDAGTSDLRDLVDAAPTLDYAPVVDGEWIDKIEPYAYTAAGREIHIFHCSACDFTWANRRMVFEYFKYCPNCGAKMDGGKENV